MTWYASFPTCVTIIRHANWNAVCGNVNVLNNAAMKSYTFHLTHDGRHRAALRDLNDLEAVYLEDLAQGSVVLKMATIATSFRAVIGKTIVTMYHH